MVRPHRRRADPEVPVHSERDGRRIARAVAPLGAPVGVAPGVIRQVAPGVDLGHVADQPGRDPFADEPHALSRMTLDPHLRCDLGFRGRPGQGPGFEDAVGEGLLRVHVLAELHRRQGDHRVGVVGCRDDNGVDILLLLQHDAVVGVELGARVSFDRLGRVVRVDVAEGDDVFGLELVQVIGALAADADAGDVELIAGRCLSQAKNVPGDDREKRRRGRRGRGRLQKIATVDCVV